MSKHAKPITFLGSCIRTLSKLIMALASFQAWLIMFQAKKNK